MRTIQNLFLAIILLSLIACKPDRPEGVLSEEKMIDVLVDMHLAEGVMSVSRVRQQFHYQPARVFYDSIFNHQNITREQFNQSVHYYSKDVNQYDKIYDEVLERLNKMETRPREEQKKERIEKVKSKKRSLKFAD